MNTHVVRQPIMDDTNSLLGYELLYQEKDSAGLYNESDSAASAIESLLLEFSNDAVQEGEKAFVTFTPDLLLKNIPAIFRPERLVIQIEDAVTINPVAQKALYGFKEQGYDIAIKDFEFSVRYFSLMDVIDYIKIDMNKVTAKDGSIAKIGNSFHKKIIAYNVNSPEAYEKAKALECPYVQGTAVASVLSSSVQGLNHLQSNFFQLMVSVTKDEPDVDEISSIISRDVTLTFSLLKLVNSAYFALRNRVNSVKQALVVLGLGQLKQWIYLLSFRKGETVQCEELIKTSFLRGSFCAELALYARGTQLAKSDAYLMGMFSTLDSLLSVSLEEALASLPILDIIKEALISRSGPCAPLYELILCYEAADWHGVTKYAAILGIPENIVSQKYFECMEQVNSIWRTLMKPVG